jgi:nitroreductase
MTPRRAATAGIGLAAVAPALLMAAAAPAALPLAPRAGDIALPPPQTQGGKPLLQALAERRSSRAFVPQAVPPQLLANLLWSAFGVNRPGGGGRTAPSAHDQQEIDVYLINAEGAFRYAARPPHRLERVGTTDLRAGADSQGLARAAPMTLLYVADDRRMTDRDDEATRRFYAAADAGVIAQNVYLFCASEGLATVVFISFDRERLAPALALAPKQRILLAQAVGYPKGSL